MQLLLQGEGGRGWGSPNSALWGDHACWKVELAIVMILSTELQLSRNIIIMTNIIFIIIRLSRNIIFTNASRHSLTLAYTNTTIIATTSFPVTWPLFAVRSTMMMTGYLKFKSEKQSQRWLFLRAWRPTQQMSKSRWMTVRYMLIRSHSEFHELIILNGCMPTNDELYIFQMWQSGSQMFYRQVAATSNQCPPLASDAHLLQVDHITIKIIKSDL